jgi:hypothetical protein
LIRVFISFVFKSVNLTILQKTINKTNKSLTLTHYKNPFRYRLPVSPPRKRTKTSSSIPNLKSPSIKTPSLFKKISFNFKIFISFQTCLHISSAQSVNLTILQKTINKTNKSPHAFAVCSIRPDLLKQENEKIDSL